MQDVEALRYRLLEWIYDRAEGTVSAQVRCGAFASEAGIGLGVVWDLVSDFAARGLVKDWSGTEPYVVLEVDGAREVEALRRRRADPQLRGAAARTGLLRWLYRQDHAGMHHPITGDVLKADESMFLGDRFTEDEIDRAAEYLYANGLIEGVTVDQARGPIHAQITAAGTDCVEQHRGNVSEYLRDRTGRGPSISTTIGTLNSSGALAVGSTGVTQNVTAGVDPAAMASFVKVLLAELPNLPLGQTQGQAAREALEAVQREVGRTDPQPERIASAFGRFVGYLMDAGKPVVTAALMLAARHMGMPPA